MSKPVLYVFAISHYCEKARWALDYLGIEYTLRYLAPGQHRKIASKLGAPQSSLPYLSVDGQLVHGSANILSWADETTATATRRLTPEAHRQECLAIEKRLDDIAGVHVRRYYYSEALVDYPQTVRPVFTHHLPLLQKLLVSAAWGKICKIMIKGMDLGHEQRLDSRRIVEGEMDWLDGLLADGRRFLAGEQLSRADLTAASLLAPLVTPAEHPVYGDIQIPPLCNEDIAGWQQRPCIQWVRDIYRQYR